MDFWLLHGSFGAIAIFIIYPLGVIGYRFPSWQVSHASVQAIGIIFTSIGGAMGLWQSATVSRTHQYLGLATMFLIYFQLCLGLILRKGNFSSGTTSHLRWMHAIQGFGALALGWYCFTTGLVLASWTTKSIVPLVLVTAVEVVAIPVISMLLPRVARYTPVVDGSEMSVAIA